VNHRNEDEASEEYKQAEGQAERTGKWIPRVPAALAQNRADE